VTELRFDGLVEYDEYGNPPTPKIGGRDVIEEVIETFGYAHKPVTVSLADERFTGDLFADEGSMGYSEWTPGDPSKLCVGDHDVLARLEELNGKTATLWIADEPVNTLGPPQK
jgi:hypothetical protein